MGGGKGGREGKGEEGRLPLVPSICPFIPGGGCFLPRPSSFATTKGRRGGEEGESSAASTHKAGGGRKKRDKLAAFNTGGSGGELTFQTLRKGVSLSAHTHKQLNVDFVLRRRSNATPTTGAISHRDGFFFVFFSSQAKRHERSQQRRSHNLIVILERISLINGSRSMASLAAFYISSNRHQSQQSSCPD